MSNSSILEDVFSIEADNEEPFLKCTSENNNVQILAYNMGSIEDDAEECTILFAVKCKQKLYCITCFKQKNTNSTLEDKNYVISGHFLNNQKELLCLECKKLITFKILKYVCPSCNQE